MIYEDMRQVEEGIDKVKSFQDKALDVYDPRSSKINRLLKELVELEKELEELDHEYRNLLEANRIY